MVEQDQWFYPRFSDSDGLPIGTLCQWSLLSMTTRLWKRVPCLLAPFHHLPCFGKLSEGTLHGALNALDLAATLPPRGTRRADGRGIITIIGTQTEWSTNVTLYHRSSKWFYIYKGCEIVQASTKIRGQSQIAICIHICLLHGPKTSPPVPTCSIFTGRFCVFCNDSANHMPAFWLKGLRKYRSLVVRDASAHFKAKDWMKLSKNRFNPSLCSAAWLS